MTDDSPRYMLYTGPSMNPTLKTGDVLHVIAYNGKKVRRGDVVVFPTPAGWRDITHRVVSVDSGVIRTLGDNNSQIDQYTPGYDELVGRVVYALRGKKRLRIYGGVAGRLFALKARSMRIVKSHVVRLLRPVYHGMARWDILKRYISPRLEIRIVSFRRSEGTEKQMLLGRKVIGRYVPGGDQWSIEPPFRLFVDVASLPKEDQSA